MNWRLTWLVSRRPSSLATTTVVLPGNPRRVSSPLPLPIICPSA